MTFGEALTLLKEPARRARRLERQGHVAGSCRRTDVQLQDVAAVHLHVDGADEKLVPWLASQTDMLADDWQVVE
jgi:putative heme iron utilization protein